MEPEKSKNYYQRFEEQMKCGTGQKLLLHACCAPCSSHCLEVLCGTFDVTVFFYNPNIDTAEEEKKRFDELIRFTEKAPFAGNVKLIEEPYDPMPFLNLAEGRELEPERGSRCYDCYKLRLEKTARYALEHGFDCFSTTLSISPYKNAVWLNEIGKALEEQLISEQLKSGQSEKGSVPYFLFSDFKKKNGYKRSIELSEEYGLYRQDYCGCRFSRDERDRKRESMKTEYKRTIKI